MKFITLSVLALGVQGITLDKLNKCEPCDDPEPEHCGCVVPATVVHTIPVVPAVSTHTTVIPGYTWSSVIPGNGVEPGSHNAGEPDASKTAKKAEEKIEKAAAKSAAVDSSHEAAADSAK